MSEVKGRRGRRPGFHHSAETRQKIRDSMMGHEVSQRTKDRISAAQVINYHPDLYTPGHLPWQDPEFRDDEDDEDLTM
jgi:hypothetical protein